MRSSLDVLSALYKIVNVQPVTDELAGKVYIGDYPSISQSEDVTLNTLNNRNDYLQTGFLNLNLYMKQVSSGRPNLKRFKELMDIIIPMVEDTNDGIYHFQIDDDKGVFKDKDRDEMYFYNLRLEFQTIKN